MKNCFICNSEFVNFSELTKHIKENHKRINITEYYKKYDSYEQEMLKNNPNMSVQCNLCNRYYRQITDYHLKPKHNITITEYKNRFPNAKTISNVILKKLSDKSSRRKHSKESKKKMSDSRKKYLSENDYVAPVLLMSEEQKKEWRKKISQSVRKTMKTPEVQKKLSEYERPEAWNKGLTIETSEIIKNATIKRMKTLEKKGKNEIFVSKIETEFLNDVEKELAHTVKRQKHIYDYDCGFGKNVDGYIETKNMKIIIEVDGVRWHNYPYGTANDKLLDDYCSRQGIEIFRFWDIEIIKKDDRRKAIQKVFDYFTDMCWFFDMQDSLMYCKDPSCVFE